METSMLEFPREWGKQAKTGTDDGNGIPDTIRAIGWLKQDRIAIAHPVPIKLN